MSAGDSVARTGNDFAPAEDLAIQAEKAAPNYPESPVDREEHTKALAALAKNHHRALLRFLRGRMGSAHDAEEVAQEAYAKMLALDRPEAVGFLVGYLWKIAGNLALDRRKRSAAQARLDPVALFEPEEWTHRRSPESELYIQQRLELVQQALAELPAKHREAFILRVLEERSFRDVGERLNVGERMAMMYVARALQYCQTYLHAAEATRSTPK